MFKFGKKKSNEQTDYDFAKMMLKVREDPDHLEQVQHVFSKNYHAYHEQQTISKKKQPKD